MGQLPRLFIVASVAALGVACAREAPNEYSYAFATPDCAPWDGPAVVLYLLDSKSDAVPPAARHIRVAIWKAESDLAHHTFRWPASPQPGAAARCASAESCEDVTDGQIAFGGIAPDSSVAGEVDFRFANGDRVRKAFTAAWQPRRIACG
jgi:hypothetical protein